VQVYSPLISGNLPSKGSFKSVKQFLLSATLAESINNLSTALTGAARTQLANPLTFKASGAAAAFIRCSLLFLKGAHGLVVPPRHGPFLLKEKD
jgi:hypothetical protein